MTAADEKAAIAALEAHGAHKPGKQCTSCKTPWVDNIDLLLRMAAKSEHEITLSGFYASLKSICPNYPLTDSGLRLHLRNCRPDESKKALG